MKKPKRFWSKVDVGEPDECWEWEAAKNNKEYGLFWIHYRLWLAHRVAWVLTYGPIPKGLCVCHRCDNPGCCNPYHLFLGTQADNLADAVRKGRLRGGGAPGEQHRRSKLTEDNVLTIRELYPTGEWTQGELAAEFGVRRKTISDVLLRKTWAWLNKGE